MIHPATELRYVNPQIGFGVFATEFIPEGTIVYVHDSLEIVLAPHDERLGQEPYRRAFARYAHTDPDGSQTLSWDIARYVNHCCQANTLSTGYGFEIAVRDILAGEEITDEYALFMFGVGMPLTCSREGCRGTITVDDLALNGDHWDGQIQAALRFVRAVPQPLWPYLDTVSQEQVDLYLDTGVGYPSVHTLRPDSPQ